MTEQMRTHLEFRAAQFLPDEGEVDGDDPGAFAKGLGLWLAQRFADKGFSTNGNLAEDWGWFVPLSTGRFSTWLGCSSYGDDKWLAFIEPSKTHIWRWFRKIDVRPEVSRIAAALEQILNESEVSDLRWWSDHESGRK